MPPSCLDPCAHALERSRRARTKGSCLVWEMRFVRREKMPKACWVVRRVDGVALIGWDDAYAGEVGFLSGFRISSEFMSSRVRLGVWAGKGAFEGDGSMPVMICPASGLSPWLSFISTGIKPSSNSSGHTRACGFPACSISASSSSF